MNLRSKVSDFAVEVEQQGHEFTGIAADKGLLIFPVSKTSALPRWLLLDNWLLAFNIRVKFRLYARLDRNAVRRSRVFANVSEHA